MCCARLAAASLVVVLAASACGDGSGNIPAEPVEDGPSGSAVPEVEAQIDAPPGTSSTMRVELEESAEPNTTPKPETATGPERHPWCGDMQAVWDVFDRAQADLVAAEARHQEVGDAAADGLHLAQGAYDAAEAVAVRHLLDAHRSHAGEADNDETLIAAFARAWEALIGVSPQAQEAAAGFESIDVDSERGQAHLRRIEEISQGLTGLRAAYSGSGELNVLGWTLENAYGAITSAERAGVAASDIAALWDAVDGARDQFIAGGDARRLGVIEAEQARQAGAIPSAAAAAEAAEDAEHAAERVVQTLEQIRVESLDAYIDAHDAAASGNTEAVLAAAATSIDRLNAAYDADSALSDAVSAAEQALLDGQAAVLSPQTVINTARDAFASAVTGVLSDADAYTAFREPIQESCR